MKKASKILTLILVFVLLAGIFSGCAMFTRNAGRYRDLVAVTVGKEQIKVGKVLDSFNNYYNMYGSYVGQGITVDWLLQMTMQSLITQAMKVDSYVSNNSPEADNTELKDFCHNSAYLTKEEIEYAIRYVKYLTFQSLDSSVQALLAVDRTIADEEKEDTSRDFTEFDKWNDGDYSEYTYRQRIFNEDAKEYFDKYYGGSDKIALKASVDEYVYQNQEAAQAKLDNLNKRLDDEDAEITFDEYKNAQDKIVKQYQRTIQNSYNITFEQFLINQVEDMVASTIAAKYDRGVNQGIDKTDGALDKTISQLEANLALVKASQTTGFALNGNFVDFIEALTSTSYIYNVPQEFIRSESNKDGYVFVKNILIPFSTQQQTMLSNLAKDLGNDTKNPAYIKLRNQLAAQVVADDFDSEKDEDGKYSKVTGIFKLDESGKVVINPQGALGQIFLADGSVKGGDEAVIANMKRFNTDTAQHTATYDYVVRVGDVPKGYSPKWVTEFVDAANEAVEIFDNKELVKEGDKSYALAVSTYGVHIVYYVGDVQSHDFKFMENYKDTSSPEYRLFSAYFSQQSSLLLEERLDELQKSYLDGSKVVVESGFNRFLKDNDFKFDLIEFLTDED